MKVERYFDYTHPSIGVSIRIDGAEFGYMRFATEEEALRWARELEDLVSKIQRAVQKDILTALGIEAAR